MYLFHWSVRCLESKLFVYQKRFRWNFDFLVQWKEKFFLDDFYAESSSNFFGVQFWSRFFILRWSKSQHHRIFTQVKHLFDILLTMAIILTSEILFFLFFSCLDRFGNSKHCWIDRLGAVFLLFKVNWWFWRARKSHDSFQFSIVFHPRPD